MIPNVPNNIPRRRQFLSTLFFVLTFALSKRKNRQRSLPTAKNFFARHSTNEFGSALTHSFFDLLIQNSSLGWSGYILEFWYSHIVLLIVFVSISRHSDAKAWPPERVASFSHNEYRFTSPIHYYLLIKTLNEKRNSNFQT